MTTADLPPINATLNGLSGVLIVIGHACIRRGKIRAHAYLMSTAVLSSAAFLTCYVIYHINNKARSIGLPHGIFRTTYLTMLLTHVLLAVVVLPMIVVVLRRAYRRDWVAHRRLAKPTYWIWLYVSVTGVLIYLILYHLVPSMYAVGTGAS